MGCKHTCPVIIEGQSRKHHNNSKQSTRISPGPGLTHRDVSQVTTLTSEGHITEIIADDEDSFVCQPSFTELQVDIINSTWPIIADDLQTQGVMMFLDLFRVEPEAQQMFDFRYVV